MPTPTASSLFDSNYSLSSPSSPVPSRPSTNSQNSSYSRSPYPQSPLRATPLVITFPHPDLPSGRTTPPLVSPTTVSPTTVSPTSIPGLSDVDNSEPLKSAAVPVSKREDDGAYSVAPESVGVEEGTQQSSRVDEDMCPELNKMAKDFELLNMRRQSSTQITGQHDNYESCMRGGAEHERRAGSYKVGTDTAYHDLSLANELYGRALYFRPSSVTSMQCRAKVLIQLATTYQPLSTAMLSLQEAVALGRHLADLAPTSVSARETLVQAASLLSSILLETGNKASSKGEEAGELAREALQVLEDIAADKMDRMRSMSSNEAAAHAPSMAETFLALSSAAITVSSLSKDLQTVNLHVELSEQALDQASNMATVSIAAHPKSPTSSANLITRVQLASGRSSLERLRHTFLLGMELDEDDFRALLTDMSALAMECRERAGKLKGTKHAAASSFAWEALKQLGEAKLVYASLLRVLWRERSRSVIVPRRKSSMDRPPLVPERPSSNVRKLSSRSQGVGVEETIHEEDEGESEEGSRRESACSSQPSDRLATPTLPVLLHMRRESDIHRSSKDKTRSRSSLGEVLENQVVSNSRPPLVRQNSGTSSMLSSGRRDSWLPPNSTSLSGQYRRSSSRSVLRNGSDAMPAWTRKSSLIDLTHEDDTGQIASSTNLAETAWELLESAVKQFKLSLPHISPSDMPPARQQQCKSDTLTLTSYASAFLAALSPRLTLADEKRASNLTTAEVYATWASREVGWSFIIEGTREAALADRRTTSWSADESGKRAVMLLLRTWWYRTASNEDSDIESKVASPDTVETVVRRMKAKEGMNRDDVARFKDWLLRWDGEVDQTEELFWQSVLQVLGE